MELEILKRGDNILEFVLAAEDHTLANLVRKTLKRDEHVTFAAYKVDHPLINKERPVLILETDGKETPKEALIKAAQTIKEQINEFGEKF